MNGSKYVSNVEDLPKDEHFAVLINATHYTPGDERSQTHPGHGYPESNDPYVKYVAFETEEQLKSWIAMVGSRYTFKVIHTKMVKIETHLEVKVG